MNTKRMKVARRMVKGGRVAFEADLIVSMRIPFWRRLVCVLGWQSPYRSWVKRWKARMDAGSRSASKRVSHDLAGKR
jgi:hypothetical protein